MIVVDKSSFSSDRAYIKKRYGPGNKSDLHLLSSSPRNTKKIPKNPDRPTLLENAGSGDGKRTIC